MGRPAWLDAVDLRRLASQLGVKLSQTGAGSCIDPTHDDNRPSMSVGKESAKCFGCGKSWSVLEFIATVRGTSTDDAREWMYEATGQKRPAPYKPGTPWRVNRLENLRAKDKATKEELTLQLVTKWEYLDADGQPVCGVARYRDPKGRKEYRPYRPHEDGGFVIGRPPNPVILYGLNRIAQAKGVIVVEGEKVAERVQALLDQASQPVAAVTWMGGASTVNGAEWSPLHGKPVYVWPDNDQQGKNAAMAVARTLHGKAKWVKVVIPDEKWEPKSDLFDLIDGGWAWPQIAEFLRGNTLELQEGEVEPGPRRPAIHDELLTNRHFRILGVTETAREHTVVIYRRATGIVRHIASPLPKVMRVLAPDRFWTTLFPVPEGKSMYAQDNLVRIYGAMSDVADREGLFDPGRIKGRGWHWVRDGRRRIPVLNTGRDIIADGKRRSFSERDEHDVWIAKKAISWGDPAADAEDSIRDRVWRLMECQLWNTPAQAFAVGGWVTLAPLCGLLRFRPGMWLRGQAGMGKSFLVNHIQDLLGDTLQLIQGESTEPGIRRTLKHDATATLIDEYEVADRAKRANVDAILALMRMASGEKGGIVLKADPSTPDGVTNTPLRTMMMFSSIARTRPEDANESRIMSVSIEKQPGMDDGALTEHMLSVIAPAAEFIEDADNVSEVFLHWVLRNVDNLLECAKMGKKALQQCGHRIRFAELHGTLLAAGFFLCNGRLPTDAEVVGLNTSLEANTGEHSRDDVRLVTRILDHRVRLDRKMEEVPLIREATLAALVRIVNGEHVDGMEIRADAARHHLAMHGVITGHPTRSNGIMSDSDSVLISTNHPSHFEALRGTRWEDSDYGEIIARGIGERVGRRINFGDRQTPAVRVMLDDIPIMAKGDEPPPRQPGEDEEEDEIPMG